MNRFSKIIAFIFTLALFTCVFSATAIGCTPADNRPDVQVTVASYNKSRGTVTLNSESYKEGDEVVVTLTPKANYEIQRLRVGGVDVTADMEDGVYTFTANADVTIEVSFKEMNSFTVTLGEVKEIEGNVTISPNKTEHYIGSIVTVTAVAKTGYEIQALTVGGVDVAAQLVNNAYSFVISEDTAIEVTFAPTVLYTVTINGLSEDDDVFASATLSNEKASYATNETTELAISAKPGYLIESVSVNGNEQTDGFNAYGGKIELTMTGNVVIEVTFSVEDLSVVENILIDEFNTLLSREGIMIVYFYADWCSACTGTAPEVQAYAELGTGAKVVKIDYGNPPSSASSVTPEQNLFYIYSTQFASGQTIPLVVVFKDGVAMAGMESSVLPITCDDIIELVASIG